MFDAPIDTLYVWVGLAAVSVVLAGVAVSMPAEPAPDAAALADTVDAVAASPYPSTAEHPVDAERLRIGTDRVTLEGPGGSAQATFAYGPVTPVRDGSKLDRVLRGTPPADLFADPAAFRRAVDSARASPPAWDRTGVVRVRRVVWEGVYVTLVGA